MTNYLKYYLVLLLLLGLKMQSNAQDCCIEQSFIINDNFSTTININVSGVFLDDLSDPSQGLCAIEIGFEHGAIGQLEGSIISPSGQIVQFIGASGVNNDITQNIYWDISFIRKSEIAEPDPGQPATWNNETTWPLFPPNNTGSYYPFMGCLEDINVGPVNGSWQIVFQDVVQTQSGNIDFIKLIFCEPDNVNCQTCTDGDLDVILNVSDIGCNGAFGTVDIESDETFIDYQWSGPGGFMSEDFLPIINTPGEYFVTLISDAGCEYIDSFNIIWEDGITDLIYEDIPFVCGQNQGQFLTSGDLSGWSFEWFGPEGFMSMDPDPTITDLGIYTLLMVSDDDLCTLNFTLEAYQTDGPIIELTSSGDISCDNPIVTINADILGNLNGVPQWSGTAQFDLLDPFNIEVGEPGWFYVTALDVSGCSAEDSVFVDNLVEFPTVVVGSMVETVIDCNNPEIELEAFASGEGVTIEWQDSGGFILPGENPLIIEPGWYYVIAENDLNCKAIDSIEIEIDTISPEIDFFVFMGGELTCLIDSVRIDVFINTPNVFPSLNWSGPNEFMSDQDIIYVEAAGTYILTVTDANGCSSVDSVIIISSQDPPGFEPIEDLTLTCLIPSQTIEAEGLSPFDACIWENDIGVISMDCDLMVSDPGLYYFSVTNMQGCTAYDTIEVFSSSDQPVIDFLYNGEQLTNAEQTFINCNKDSIELTFIADMPIASQIWTFPDNSTSLDIGITVFEPGNYSYLIQAENGCLATGNLNIFLDTIPPSVELVTDTIDCNNDMVSISVIDQIGEAVYEWSGPELLMPNVSSQTIGTPGDYFVTITDLFNGCTTDTLIEVISNFQEAELNLMANDIPCNGDPVVISVQSDLVIESANWIGPNFNSDILEPAIVDAGWYFIEVTTSNGCMSNDSIFIDTQSELPIFGISLDTISCVDQIIQVCALDVNDDLSVEWLDDTGAVIGIQTCINISEVATYALRVTGQNGCIDSLIFDIIDQFDDASLLIEPTILNECSNLEMTLSATWDGIIEPIFEWSTLDGNIVSMADQEVIEIDQLGLYTLSVFDAQSPCTITEQFIVEDISFPINDIDLDIIEPDCINGNGGSIEVIEVNGGISPYNFELVNIQSQSNPLFENLTEGDYELIITDGAGCSYSFFIPLESQLGFNVNLGPDITVDAGVTFSVATQLDIDADSITEIQWSGSLLAPCLDCLSFEESVNVSGSYIIHVTDNLGCVDEDTLNIFILVPETNFELANIFSPNGDGQNETFGINVYQSIETIDSFRIFDRWGNLMFEVINGDPKNSANQWDGRFNGQIVDSGVYVFQLELSMIDGTQKSRSGSVTLIK